MGVGVRGAQGRCTCCVTGPGLRISRTPLPCLYTSTTWGCGNSPHVSNNWGCGTPPPCLYHLGLYPDKLQPLFSICLWAGTLPAQQLELCPQAPSPGPIKQTGTLKPLKPTTSDHQATERLLSYPGLR